jgi:hypothetical protein
LPGFPRESAGSRFFSAPACTERQETLKSSKEQRKSPEMPENRSGPVRTSKPQAAALLRRFSLMHIERQFSIACSRCQALKLTPGRKAPEIPSPALPCR